MMSNEHDPYQTNDHPDTATGGRTKESATSLPRRIGRYRLLQKIAEGGMGAVYMAEQDEPVKRRVAIKLIKGGSDSKQVIARFEAERQALAMMEHPNIARIYDAGTTSEGEPFFVMELVKGIPLTQYCDQHQLSIQERLKLFIPVCRAVQHAHIKGVIHRDLKPSNVLVARYDSEPVAKVIDFGLAKAVNHQSALTDKTLFTQFGQIVGTLQYMSPEQAELNQLDVDTRTDIYSLGVMLYELLTGSPPLDRAMLGDKAILKILQIIRDEEPPKPSTRLSESSEAIKGLSQQRQIDPSQLCKILKTELDWIVMKSLEKDRDRRYNTANEFADELTRYINGEESTVRPPSFAYRMRKTLAKHKKLVASISAVFFLLIAGVVGTGTMWLLARAESERANNEAIAKEQAREREQIAREKIEQQRDEIAATLARAIASEKRAGSSFAKSSVLLAQTRWQSNRLSDAQQILDSVPKSYRKLEWYLTRRQFENDGMNCPGHTAPVKSVDISPDGTLVASAGDDHVIRIHDVATSAPVVSIDKHTDSITSVRFLNDQQLISASVDGSVRSWNLSTLAEQKVWLDSKVPVIDMDVSDNRETMTSLQKDGKVRVWSLQSGKPVADYQDEKTHRVVVSPDGEKVISLVRGGLFELELEWLLADGEFGKGTEGFETVSGIVVFDWKNDEKSFIPIRLPEFQANTINVSPTGKLIAIGGFVGEESEFLSSKLRESHLAVLSFGVKPPSELKVYSGQSEEITAVKFTPDGTALLVGHSNGITQSFGINGRQFERIVSRNEGRVNDLAVTPEGFECVTCAENKSVKISELVRDAWNDPIWIGTIGNLTASEDGEQIAFGTLASSSTLLVDFANDSQRLLKYLEPGRRFSPSSKYLASWDGEPPVSSSGLMGWLDRLVGDDKRKNRVSLIDFESNKKVGLDHPSQVSDVRFSGDEQQMLVGLVGGELALWSVPKRKKVRTLQASESPISCVAISPDGNRYAAGSVDKIVRVWGSDDSPVALLDGHSGLITNVCFGTDPEQVIVADDQGIISIWNLESGELVKRLAGHEGPVTSIAITFDGTRLVSSGVDQSLRAWDCETGVELLAISTKHPAFDLHITKNNERLIWRELFGELFHLEIGLVKSLDVGVAEQKRQTSLSQNRELLRVSRKFFWHIEDRFENNRSSEGNFADAFHLAWVISYIHGDSKEAKLFQHWKDDSSDNIYFTSVFPDSLDGELYEEICKDFREMVGQLSSDGDRYLPPVVEHAMELIEEE